MRNLLIALPLIGSLFIGCGGGSGGDVKSSSSSSSSVASSVVSEIRENLKIGEAITVNSGDKLYKVADDSEISITHDLDNDVRTVTLLNGEVYIVRAN